MSTLTKKRVRWYELNNGEVKHNEDVDILTSADAVTFDDGETLQHKYSNGHLAKSSELGDLSALSTTNNSNLVDSVNEVDAKVESNTTSITNLSTNKANKTDVYTKTEIDELNGFTLTSTLTASQTSLTFADERITEDSILSAVYTSIFGVGVKSAEITNGSLVLTFKAQIEDMTVKVVIK